MRVSSLLHHTGPFAERNARLYVLFTTFYNARAYYPVLAIFFTDLGLGLEQYVMLNRRFTSTTSLALGGAAAVVALLLLAPAWPWFGLLPAAFLMMLLGYVSFTISRFLHGVAESHERATLLSVKGLVFNLGYGLYSFAFSLLLIGLGNRGDRAFQCALYVQAGYFALALLVFVVLSRRRGEGKELKPGGQ